MYIYVTLMIECTLVHTVLTTLHVVTTSESRHSSSHSPPTHKESPLLQE